MLHRFILHNGRVQVQVTENGRPRPVAVLSEGDFFGEMGLFTGEPRTASVIALDETSPPGLLEEPVALGFRVMPAVAALLPGVDLNPALAVVPVLNTSLVSKEIITGTYHWDLIALIFLSSSVYAALALAIAVKLFQREDVLFRT